MLNLNVYKILKDYFLEIIIEIINEKTSKSKRFYL